MNATRDNAERMNFVGFDPVMIRGLALTLSAGFAGIAGALYALAFQVVTLDTSASRRAQRNAAIHTSAAIRLSLAR